MINLHIENFKSIDSLDLELGRLNLFIGENGCGKSNILEALGMAAAAATLDLSTAALKARGIRVTGPSWMRSAFEESKRADPVLLALASANALFLALLTHDNTPYGAWRNQIASELSSQWEVKSEFLNGFIEGFNTNLTWHETIASLTGLPSPPSSAKDDPNTAKRWAAMGMLIEFAKRLSLTEFLAYAPREDVLRDLARDSDVEPIGVHGEGLFKLLQVLDSDGQLPEVKEQLALLGWFDDLSVAAGVNPSSRALQIRDVFLSGDTPFDQRSANEGFLFVLLYACLLISMHTPRFFAVDNVDTALNPKLCAGAVRMFAALTKKYDRRVLLTAHNPGALDGLDLNDDEQRLFVVYRNTEGRTRARRILPADLPAGAEPVRLSEAFLRGYLGALPTNF